MPETYPNIMDELGKNLDIRDVEQERLPRVARNLLERYISLLTVPGKLIMDERK